MITRISLLALGCAAALPAGTSAASAITRATPGTYLGETNDQLPVRLHLDSSNNVGFRIRYEASCTGEQIPGGSTRSIGNTASGPVGQAPSGQTQILPVARLTRGTHVSTRIRFIRVLPDADRQELVIRFDARFVSSRRISGTVRFTSDFVNGEAGHVTAHCVSAALRFTAYRLA
jgi:hypothetical protein